MAERLECAGVEVSATKVKATVILEPAVVLKGRRIVLAAAIYYYYGKGVRKKEREADGLVHFRHRGTRHNG